MLTAKQIFSRKMQSIPALNLKPGDFVQYIGKWQDKVNAFVEGVEIVENQDKTGIEKVRVKLDSGESFPLDPGSNVIGVKDSGKDEFDFSHASTCKCFVCLKRRA